MNVTATMQQTPYYVYIVECTDKSLYVGQTNNLEKRLQEHNGILPGGAKYTLGRNPVILRYVEKHSTRSLAMKHEYQLKKLTHLQKKELCDTFLFS